jgi:hypothetical protein
LPLVELPEAELVIEIEDDEEFVSGPAHGWRMGKSGENEKP